MDTKYDIQIGEPIPHEELASLWDRDTLVLPVRAKTFALAARLDIDWIKRARHLPETGSQAQLREP